MHQALSIIVTACGVLLATHLYLRCASPREQWIAEPEPPQGGVDMAWFADDRYFLANKKATLRRSNRLRAVNARRPAENT